ncbi:MAG: DUF4142 domain-containing protein [Deltaproteobacteria bacterium]|nr:DUF4142 domain-containing protein [Deltaproteobacteria bacterium]
MFQLSHLIHAAAVPLSIAALFTTRSCLRDTKPLSRASPSLEAAQVADAAQALDQAEIDEASLAVERAATPEVRQFAHQVADQSTHERDRLASLLSAEHIAVMSGEVGEQVRHSANATHAALMLDKGVSFDRDYLSREVKSCENAVSRLDVELLPHARDDALKSRLRNVTRAEFEDRLETAKTLQLQLTSKLADAHSGKPHT